MRLITDHKVPNSSMEEMDIFVVDEPGIGGASHEYLITTDFSMRKEKVLNIIRFQRGTVKTVGINGISQEVLLAIVIDRLRSFQAGDFKCMENEVALKHVEQALKHLKNRTMKRVKSGIEGELKTY